MTNSISSSLMAAVKPLSSSPLQYPFLQNPPRTLSLPLLSTSHLKQRSVGVFNSRQGDWSIRDDLMKIEANIHAKEKGPPPMVMDRFHGVIDQLFHHRIIRFGGPLEDDVSNVIVSQLLYLDALDHTKDIVMYINSPGGSVTAGMAIFDTMKHIRCDVSTVCVGLAASMAGFLLAAGTKGKRFSLPNARIMIHQPSAGTQGSHTDIEIQVHEVMHHSAVLTGYLAYQTGQSIEKVTYDTGKDFFMSAKEAKEYGLIDDIITNPLKSIRAK